VAAAQGTGGTGLALKLADVAHFLLGGLAAS
jgi:hypothetical protein